MKDTPQLRIFQDFQEYTPKWYIFKNLFLGKLHDTLPWEELAACLPPENQGPGAPKWFDAKGMFALMFLKSYFDLSDEKLIERFNTDWGIQMFCGKLLRENQVIRDAGIIGRIRAYMAEHADWQKVQEVLLNAWKGDIDNTHVLFMDASCYESYIRFPTDVKLLWECCQWIFEKQLFKICKKTGIKRPRSKYHEQKKRQLGYARKRKKTYKETLKRRKSLIYLLEKGLGQLQEVISELKGAGMADDEFTYLKTIKTVLSQQTFLLSHPSNELKNRIVSLPRPYVRPIKRGKENKSVEFGMKVHMLQVDGISFLDTMDFNNFNECTRLRISVLKHKSIFGLARQLGADGIYATNSNRRYCTEKKIFTSFPKKGPSGHSEAEKILRGEISRQRSTVMEGVFGDHKNHYGLRKIRVKGEKKEKLMVFFATMTANAVKIAKRREKKESPPLLDRAA